MSAKPEITARFFTPEGNQNLASTRNPRKCIIKSGYGAMNRRCWLEFYNSDLNLPVSLGNILELWINGMRCFRGRIAQRRIDSIDDYLSIYAEWDPERAHNIPIGGIFENQTATEILNQILTSSGLVYAGGFSHDIRFSRLEFAEYPLFSAIDLLAKLAGNWLWGVSDDSILTFKPPTGNPEQILYLREDLSVVNLWETYTDIALHVLVHGGVVSGSTYENWIEIPEREYSAEEDLARIYARPITTPDVFSALRRAVIEQMTGAHYEHYVELSGAGETIQPGDRVRMQVENVPIFPKEQIFRVLMREITYAHENLQTQLHLVTGFSSAPTYFYYLKSDRKMILPYMGGKVGAFQLDISALDTAAHLDAA